MANWIARLFDTADFPPRWSCGRWSDALGWTHIASDLAIFGAYMAIPCTLAYFVLRRRDVPFIPVFWLFAVFIVSCGVGHLVEASLFWYPWYRFGALIKVVIAIASWCTVIAIIPILPQALRLPGMASVNRKLAASNRELERYSRAMTDREYRVIDLKLEVNALLGELGREPRYLAEGEPTAHAEAVRE